MELASPLPPRVRKSNTRLGLIMTALIVLAVGYGVTQASAFQWFLLRVSLRSQYPRVQWITPSELAALQDKADSNLVLLDVRTAAEWQVSHLPGAVRIEPGSSAEALPPNLPRTALIVGYCAVGYRSAAVLKRFGAEGFTNGRVLDGGIFAWANEHRPLVRDGQPATRVHPYTAFWGRLLNDDVRAPVHN